MRALVVVCLVVFGCSGSKPLECLVACYDRNDVCMNEWIASVGLAAATNKAASIDISVPNICLAERVVCLSACPRP